MGGADFGADLRFAAEASPPCRGQNIPQDRTVTPPIPHRNDLGWRAEQSFESGLARTVDWYLANADWVARVLDGSYRLERIGTEA